MQSNGRSTRFEWSGIDAYNPQDYPAFAQRWVLLAPVERMRKSAELEVFGESEMREAWKDYCRLLEREHADWDINGEQPSREEEAEMSAAIARVIEVGRRHGASL